MGRDWVRAFIGLGANAGDPLAQIEQAFDALLKLPATVGLQRSRLYRTAPWQAQGPDFINAMAQVDTQLSAPELLAHMQRIEQAAGRIRPYHHAPRTLDLDLIFYGQAVIHSAALVLPHPRWRERAFVLRPLSDLAPERILASDWAAVAGQDIKPLAA
jgi:2-amino-4-hydroxy-6-hydroxymethyldihydropteridine diphosphokinase